MLLDYLSTYPYAKIRYTKSDIILPLDSDAAYLVAPKARSRVAGCFYSGQQYNTNISPSTTPNGPIHIGCKTLNHVVASAAEAETTGLFHNYQTAVHMRNMLTALNHLQPATHTKTDKSIASGFVNDTLKENVVKHGMSDITG